MKQNNKATAKIKINKKGEELLKILNKISLMTGYNFNFEGEKGAILDIFRKDKEPKMIYFLAKIDK